MSIKINKINWGQFGCRTISIKTNRVPVTGATVEILERDKYGNRIYPNKYKVTQQSAYTTKRFPWGFAFVYKCDDLEENYVKNTLKGELV